jgi:hypothetical protein
VQAYIPRDPRVLWIILGIVIAQVLLGFVIAHRLPRGLARCTAWLATVVAVAAVDRVLAHDPPGLRMLAFILVGLFALKVVVLVEEPRKEPAFPFSAWLAFALGWPGMRPSLFAHPKPQPLEGAHRLIRAGALYFAAGALLLIVSRVWASAVHEKWSATAIFFLGSSLLVHFGAFDLLAGMWRNVGVACEALFRAPWLAQSLSEFWSRRWNLAFSEMTAIAVYRPLSGTVGRGGALMASFLVSGVLHEMAISLPVRAGFGLPTAYFALHGLRVLVERHLARLNRPIGGWVGRVWTLAWLVVPLPILFHRAFLEGIVWPLIGIR